MSYPKIFLMSRWEINILNVIVSGGRDTYKPSEDTLLLASNISSLVVNADVVFDVGTGSGVLAILASKSDVYTVAIDISIDTLYDAYKNICRNNVDKNMDIILGDALESIRHEIDGVVVISNPPYLPGIHNLKDDHLYISGSQGIEVASKIAWWISKCPGGTGYIILSSYSNLELFRKILENLGLRYEIVDKMVLNGETLFLYKIEK